MLSSLGASGRAVGIFDAVGDGIILNDDSATLSIGDVLGTNEGNAGTQTYSFSVELTAPVDTNVSIDFATADDSAAAGSDYVSASGTVTLTAGATTATVDVTVNGDNTVELDEQFFVNLIDATLAAGGRAVTVLDNQGVGEIVNDDSATLTIDDVTAVEGDAGTTAFNFTVTLSNPVDVAVTFDHASADDTATTGDSDYTGLPLTGTTITAGATTSTITVQVTGDNTVELDEQFFVDLSNLAAGGRAVTITDNQGVGTILNDDAAEISIDDVSVVEGDAGTVDFIFTISLSNPVDVAIGVDHATADGNATAGSDYTAIPTTTTTFLPGAVTATVTVTANSDQVVELDETFTVDLSNLAASGRSVTILDNQGLGTILNDDSATLSIDDVSLLEGTGGSTTAFVFTVTHLGDDVDTSFTVDFATADGTTPGNDAQSTSDYMSNSGTLTFSGTTPRTQSITVDVNHDGGYELFEEFLVNLSNILAGGRAVTFADNQGLGTILNDDTDLIINGTPDDDTLTIIATSNDDGFYTLTTNGVAGPSIPLVDITSVTFNGADGDDVFLLDQATNSVIFSPVGGLFFNGQGHALDAANNPNGDELIVDGVVGDVTHDVTAFDSGVVFDSSGTMITYTGLEPVSVFGTIANLTMNLGVLDNDAILTTSGSDLLIASTNATFEDTIFSAPTVSLTVNGGLGADNFVLDDISSLFVGALTIDLNTGGLAAEPDSLELINGAVYNNNVTLLANDSLSGDGTVSGKVSSSFVSSTITSTGNLTLGDGSSTGFSTEGDLIVGANVVTLLDSGLSVLGENTTIAGGTLNAVNGISLSSGETLQGFGDINAPISQNTGSVDPQGVLNANLGVDLDSGDFEIEINSLASYDQLVVTGSVDLGGNLVLTTSGFTGAGGDVFVIIDNNGADPVTGSFTGLASGDTVSIGADEFKLFYNGGDGNDVVLVKTFVPLPIVYVDDNFAVQIPGQDPDGAGPATSYLVDSFPTIQEGVDAVDPSGTVEVYTGIYSENVVTSQPVTIQEATGESVIVDGSVSATDSLTLVDLEVYDSSGSGAVISMGATELILDGVTAGSFAGIAVSTTGTSDITIVGSTFLGSSQGLTIAGAGTVEIDTSVLTNFFASSVNTASLVYITGAANDTVEINTPAIGGPTHFRHLGNDILNLSGTTLIDLDTGLGEDDVTVVPDAVAQMILNGNDPFGVFPGDQLTYIAPPGGITDTGSVISAPGVQDVTYSGFEFLNIAGNIVINGGGLDDLLEITATGSDSGTYQLTLDVNGSPIVGPVTGFTGLNSLTFNGNGGSDELRVHNPVGGQFDPTGGVTFNGGIGSDFATIDDGAVTTVGHVTQGETAGEVYYDGVLVLDLNDVESLTDDVGADNRIFTTTIGDEGVVVSPGMPGLTLFDSTLGSMPIEFANPAVSLTVSLTVGNDTLDLQSLDAGFAANLTAISDGGDAIDVTGAVDAQDISLQADDIHVVVTGSLTSNNNEITLTGSSLLDGQVDAGGSELTLIGDAAQTVGPITAADLLLLGTTFSLTDTANDFGTMAGLVTSSVTIADTNNLIVGVVDSFAGLNTLSVGDVTISVAGDLTLLAPITALTRSVDLTAGGAIIGDGTSLIDISAADLTMLANTGIGSGIDPIHTAIQDLVFNNLVSGDAAIDNNQALLISADSGNAGGNAAVRALNDLTIDTSVQVSAFGGVVVLSSTTGGVTGDALFPADVVSDVGLIVDAGQEVSLSTDVPNVEVEAGTTVDLFNSGGPLTIGGLSSLTGIDAGGAVNVETDMSLTVAEPVDSEGGGVYLFGDGIAVNAGVTSNGGAIYVESVSNIDFSALGFVDTETGTGDATVDADGNVDMADGSFVEALGGNVGIFAGGDITLGRASTNNDAIVDAFGSIIDGGDVGGADVQALRTQLFSATGASGSGSNPLDLQTSFLEAQATNGLWAGNQGDLTIGLIDTTEGLLSTAGPIVLNTAGSLDVQEDVVANSQVLLTTIDVLGGGEWITVRTTKTVSSDTSDLFIFSGDDLTLEDSSTVSAFNGTVWLTGDVSIADPGLGSSILLYGTIDSGSQGLVFGGPDQDFIDLNPGAGHSADSLLLDGQQSDDSFFVQFGRLDGTIDIIDTGASGGDEAFVNGTDADELIDVHNNVPNGSLQTGGFVDNTTLGELVTYTTTLEFLTVHGQDGEDCFDVQPSQSTEITINGGAPTFGDPLPNGGDKLDFDPFNNYFFINGKTIETEGGSPDPFMDVHFRNIEQLPLDPIGTDTLLFDFDNADPPGPVTAAGYTSVLEDTVYGVGGNTFGWDVALDSSGLGSNGGFDRGAGSSAALDDLVRDGNYASFDAVFTTDIADGWYLVSAKLGDDLHARDAMTITDLDSGRIMVDSVDSPAGQFRDVTFVLYIDDGTANLQFSTLGVDPYWTVNSLEFRPADLLTIGTPDPGPITGDGVTRDTFLGFEATPNALITITSSFGEVPTDIDVSPDFAGVQVQANALGEFSYDLIRPAGRGQALIGMQEITGEQTGCLVIDFVAPQQWLLDFDRDGNSPTEAGYLSVAVDREYATGDSGIGWDTALNSSGGQSSGGFQRTFVSPTDQQDARVDGHYSGALHTFTAEVQPGTYYVNATVGDSFYARDQIAVTINGVMLNGGPITTSVNQYFHDTVVVNVGGAGVIEVMIDDLAGDPYWVLNSLEIRRDALITPVTFDQVSATPVPADGSTIYTVTGTAAVPDGTLLTVDVDFGTILDPTLTLTNQAVYQGVQVEVFGGVFSFDYVAPGAAVTPTFRAEAVDGSAVGESNTVIDFAAPPFLRFDFNGTGNLTETGFLGVRGTELWSSGDAYGWLGFAPEFQRSSFLSYSVSSVSLYQDGAWGGPGGSGQRTFRVAVDSGSTYDLQVYIGDRNVKRDQIFVSTENGLTDVQPAPLLANNFGTLLILGAQDVNSDGYLDITFGDLGGTDPYWVVNGFDIAESTLLPAAAPELAETVGGDAAPITAEQLEAVRLAALDMYAAAGVNASELAMLANVPIQIRDMDSHSYLGLSAQNRILIDDNAAGAGWNVDVNAMPLPGQVDLLTTVLHELGHQLGHDDHFEDSSDLMFGRLGAGEVRRLDGGLASGALSAGTLADEVFSALDQLAGEQAGAEDNDSLESVESDVLLLADLSQRRRDEQAHDLLFAEMDEENEDGDLL
ncbi:MAG: hypothetical protein KDB14_32460 [Planctomycetales bacterium]|nr:hypothetical protein [Planctomycetales bacterium]